MNPIEKQIALQVQIPNCKACRDQITELIQKDKEWERVEIGYPTENGSSVILMYMEGKYPNVDYWELAERAKQRLRNFYYRVL